MLAKRIIPCLDVKDGRTVKGVKFVQLRDAGDPVELAARYSEEGADELVLLDITATHEKRKTVVELSKKVAKELNIPFTIGGGIKSVADVDAVLEAGADKVSINSAAVRSPQLIRDLADAFGSQCIVVAIDARQTAETWEVYLNGGRIPAGIDLMEWAQQCAALGAGEILFTSMDHDGTKNGFAIDALAAIADALPIPVIASGGAGNGTHFTEVFNETNVSAALAASIFHFGEVPIPTLKQQLAKDGIPVRI